MVAHLIEVSITHVEREAVEAVEVLFTRVQCCMGDEVDFFDEIVSHGVATDG